MLPPLARTRTAFSADYGPVDATEVHLAIGPRSGSKETNLLRREIFEDA